MSDAPQKTKERFHVLDLLRGFFIVVITWDHLSRWPSLLGIFTGKGVLWVTAAEGFVIISGLLVGYIRGFKARTAPIKEVALSLWRRALILYIWAALGSIVYTAVMWNVTLVGGAPGMPIEKNDWHTLIIESVTLEYTFLWVYFLKLYAIFLAIAPLFILLLRKSLGWVAVATSFLLLCLGWAVESQALQWQFLFFIPATIGYYMSAILSWWRARSKQTQRTIYAAGINIAALTIILSYIGVFHPSASSTLTWMTTTLFSHESMSLVRALLAFIWFTSAVFIFNLLEKPLQKYLGWLLMPIGRNSLTAYILHGAVIIGISYVFTTSENIFVNTFLGIIALIAVWSLLKIPGINKVIPR